jgi:hypothetical protein
MKDTRLNKLTYDEIIWINGASRFILFTRILAPLNLDFTHMNHFLNMSLSFIHPTMKRISLINLILENLRVFVHSHRNARNVFKTL